MEPILMEPVAPERREDKPMLRVERNRWFVAVLALCGVMALLLMLLWFAFVKAQNNKEVVYVKLEPNGGWSMVDYQPDDAQLFYKTTIDALLQRFALSRYAVTPETIETDWGEASVFMSPDVNAQFLSPQGFNALEKIEALRKNGQRAVITIDRGVEHYDQVAWKEGDASTSVVRSNVYLTRQIEGNGRNPKPEHLVLNLQWRLADKSELAQRSMASLRLNPLGLTVLSYQLTKERRRE